MRRLFDGGLEVEDDLVRVTCSIPVCDIALRSITNTTAQELSHHFGVSGSSNLEGIIIHVKHKNRADRAICEVYFPSAANPEHGWVLEFLRLDLRPLLPAHSPEKTVMEDLPQELCGAIDWGDEADT